EITDAPPVPHDHGARAVVAFGNDRFEVEVFDGVVFRFHRQSLVDRIETRTARNGKALQYTSELEAKVPVPPSSIVQVDDEGPALRSATAIRGFRAERFVGTRPVPFGFVRSELWRRFGQIEYSS